MAKDIFLCFFHTIGMEFDVTKQIETDFGKSADLVVRPAVVGKRKACYFAIEGLTDKQMLEERVIKPLSKEDANLAEMEKTVFLSSPVKRVFTLSDAEKGIAEEIGRAHV